MLGSNCYSPALEVPALPKLFEGNFPSAAGETLSARSFGRRVIADAKPIANLASGKRLKPARNASVIWRIKCSQLRAEWAAGVLVSPDNRWICHKVQVYSAGGVFFFRLLLGVNPVGGMAGFEVVSSSVGRLQKSYEDHAAVANAILEGRPDEAARLMREHLSFGRHFLLVGDTSSG